MNFDWVEPSIGKLSGKTILRMMREQLYATALKQADGNRAKAAKLLNLHRNTYDYWLKTGRREKEMARFTRRNSERRQSNRVFADRRVV